jgi:hypothetical protein
VTPLTCAAQHAATGDSPWAGLATANTPSCAFRLLVVCTYECSSPPCPCSSHSHIATGSKEPTAGASWGDIPMPCCQNRATPCNNCTSHHINQSHGTDWNKLLAPRSTGTNSRPWAENPRSTGAYRTKPLAVQTHRLNNKHPWAGTRGQTATQSQPPRLCK